LDKFEYVMVLVSIIIGLGITHILSAVGMAIHRLRGYGEPITVSLTYCSWIATMFVWLVGFWWWEFKFSTVATEWSAGLYFFVVSYAVCLYLTTVVLVPKSLEGVQDTYEYFFKGRKWFFFFFYLSTCMDIADTALKGSDWATRTTYIPQLALYIFLAALGLFSTKRSVQRFAGVSCFFAYVLFTFIDLPLLGRW
jgi:hypothetical protein